jgi:hypothetical protein
MVDDELVRRLNELLEANGQLEIGLLLFHFASVLTLALCLVPTTFLNINQK